MRFIEDEGSTFTKQKKLENEDVGTRSNFFTWVTVIMVLLGLNIGSWAFCNMVFGHPEHPFSYDILTKLEKITPLRGYKSTTVPQGRFSSSKSIYQNAYQFSDAQLVAYNNLLMRSYLWNYGEKHKAKYIYGDFTVDEVQVLGESDLFRKGLAVTGTAYKFPDAKIKLILPTTEALPEAEYYKTGDTLKVRKSDMAATIIHIERPGKDLPMTFTAVPLVTLDSAGKPANLQTTTGKDLTLQIPETLNIVEEG